MSTNGRLTVTWDEYMLERAPSVPSIFGDGLVVRGGGYLLIGGDTGVGKTVLVSNLLIAGGAGWASFLGFPLPGRPVTSLILEAEGNRYLFRDRIRQIAENLGVKASLPIHFHERNAELLIEGPNLEAMIAETGAEIVFMDTIGRFWTGDELNATAWRAGVTVPLAKIAAAYNVAFIIGDHFNKPSENRTGSHKIRGTPAKIQDCGAAMRLEVGRGGGRSRILFFDRVKDGPLPFPDRDPSRMPLELDVKAGTVQLDERQDADLGDSAEPRVKDVRDLVTKLGPTRVSTASLRLAIQSELDLEKSRATDLISVAVRAKAIESAGRGYYRLPGALTEAL